MKRPLLWAVVWFALGEVLVLSAEVYMRTGILIGMSVFGVAIFLKNKKHSYILFSLLLLWGRSFCHDMQGDSLYTQMQEEKKSGKVNSEILVEGVVGSVKSEGEITLRVYYTEINGTHTGESYKLTAKLETAFELATGQRVLMKGRPEPYPKPSNPGTFDMRNYYRARGICFTLKDARVLRADSRVNKYRRALSRLRDRAAATLDRACPKTESGLYKAILLGDKSGVDADTRLMLQRVSIGHVLSISGLHVSLMAGILLQALRTVGVSYIVSLVVSVLAILSYGSMTGFGLATLRAVIMLCMSAIGGAVGKSYDLPTATAVALLIMMLENPWRILDGGFLLSFAAVIGVVLGGYVCKCIRKRYGKNKLAVMIMGTVVVPFCISIVTLPLILRMYGEFCPYSVLANIIVVPLMTVVVVSGGLAIICPFAAGIAAYPGCLVLRLYRSLSGLVLSMPGAAINTGCPDMVEICAYYLCLGTVIFVFSGAFTRVLPDKKHIKTVRFFLAILCVVLSVAVIGVRESEKSVNRAVFMDVGQGDGCLINTEAHVTLMVDGGSASNESLGEYVITPVLKYYRSACVDYWFVSHTDTDHTSGLVYALQHPVSGIQIRHIVLPEYIEKDEEYHKLVSLAKENEVDIIQMNGGDKIRGEDFCVTALHPDTWYDDKNDASLALLYESKEMRILFTGDMGKTALEHMLETYGSVLTASENQTDILKVAHHGSRNSYCGELYDKFAGASAVISCGRNNMYGHPHNEVLEALNKADIRVYRTDETGAVIVEKGKISVAPRRGECYN